MRGAILALLCSVCAGLRGPHLRAAPYGHRATVRMLMDDEPLPDSFSSSDFSDGLLKLPRLTTPERQRFEDFRKRQQQRTFGTGDEDDGRPPPLGMDPVEGDPVDLKALFDEQGSLEQTAEQVAAAEADMGTRLADDDGEISAVDKLLGKD